MQSARMNWRTDDGARMNEERAEVVAVHPDRIELAARDVSTCGRCAARSGCGHGLLDTLGRARRRTFSLPRSSVPGEVVVGEELLVGVPEGAIVRAAAAVYGLPLAGLVVGAVTAPAGDGSALLLAGLGFGLGWLLARRVLGSRGATTLRCRRPLSHVPASEAEPRTLSVV